MQRRTRNLKLTNVHPCAEVFDAHGFGWTPGVGDGPGGLACWDSEGCKELDRTKLLN